MSNTLHLRGRIAASRDVDEVRIRASAERLKASYFEIE
jgi:hypothetical protein